MSVLFGRTHSGCVHQVGIRTHGTEFRMLVSHYIGIGKQAWVPYKSSKYSNQSSLQTALSWSLCVQHPYSSHPPVLDGALLQDSILHVNICKDSSAGKSTCCSQRTHSVKDPCLIAHNLLYLDSQDASGTQGHLYTLCTCPHTDKCQHIIEDKILFSKQETIRFDSFLLIINTRACTCVCGACAMSCMRKSRRQLWIGLRQGVCQPC